MANYFTIEALPARKGDSLVIHYGTDQAPKLCVVDGGPSQVYGPSLRPRLQDIRDARGLAEGRPLDIDLLMVSHIDDDHIKGLLDFAQELEDARADQDPQFARVRDLWHNTFDDILGNTPGQLQTATAALASVGAGGVLPQGIDEDGAKVLASVGQGYKLRGYSQLFNWPVNKPFAELVMMEAADSAAVDRFGPGLEITVIGPRKAELEKLQKKYDDYLREKGLGRSTAEAALAAVSQDKSISNLASIVVLMQAGGKTMLLTGDALGGKVLEALQQRGLASAAAPLKVDVLKMPHHGSDRNVTPEFFRQIKADHYVFCCDGEHGNPERRTVEMLLAEQGGAPVTLHFTYALDRIDAKRKAEALGDGHGWVDADDSLKLLLDGVRAAGRPVTVNEAADRTGVRIELLDPVGF